MKPIDASKNAGEKRIYSNLENQRVRQDPNFSLRQLVRTPDIKKVFLKGDSTTW